MFTQEDFRSKAKADLSKKIDRMVDSGQIKTYNKETLNALVNGASHGIDRNVEFKQRFGSFYRYAEISTLLNISRQAVHNKQKDNKILVVTTQNGTKLCPAFQFTNGSTEPTISSLVNILLSGGVDPWSVLYWLTTPLPDREGKTAVEAIYGGGGHSEGLKELAREDAALWV